MAARVAILTPFASPSVRGNAVTVARIVQGLTERGVALRVWDLSARPESAIAAEVEAYRPALVHAFHAHRTGRLALALARRMEVPLVVTFTGTDANHDLFDPERAAAVRRVLEGAALLTAFHASIAARVGTAMPDVLGRIVVVPQSVGVELEERIDLRDRCPLPAGAVSFLLPAAIRPVKNPMLPLDPLERLIGSFPEIHLLYAGPLLDPETGEVLLRRLAPLTWAHYLGTVPHAQMASLMSQVDVVVNCSISEGGMANSVLEALAAGRAVLASDIEGNRSLIDDGVTGFLFRDEIEFERRAAQMVRDRGLRERLGGAGRDLVTRRYPRSREIDGYCEVYRALIPVEAWWDEPTNPPAS